MTISQREIVDKYMLRVDSYADDTNKIDSDIVKSLMRQMIAEYEYANDYPRVDFWGYPID